MSKYENNMYEELLKKKELKIMMHDNISGFIKIAKTPPPFPSLPQHKLSLVCN